MRFSKRLARALVVTTTALAVPAYASSSAEGAPDGYSAETPPAAKRGDLRPTWLIPHMRSVLSGGNAATTVISVHNTLPISCGYSVDFFFENDDSVPVCTVSSVLSPSVLFGAGMLDVEEACSRNAGVGVICNQTCSPELVFNTGRAIVNVDARCGTDVVVDARLYHATEAGNTVFGANLLRAVPDTDGDGTFDSGDNCTQLPNPAQRDTDSDNIGNVCDPDIAPAANDCVVNFLDLNAVKAAFFSDPASPGWNPDADFDGDNAVSFPDLATMKAFFFGAPGPSGQPNACD